MSEPLLRIRNNHVAGCGNPPILGNDDPALYVGYFENVYGEQWVFTCDRKSGKAELRGGDVGWDKAHEVNDGTVAGLILGAEESAWLAACWRASAAAGRAAA